MIDVPASVLRGDDDTVNTRARPGLSPVGMPIGGFRLYPSLETRGSYDSNIYTLPDAPVGDAALLVTPRLTLTSIETRRYAVSLAAEGTIARYVSRTIENSESVAAVARGRTEIDRDTRLLTSVTVARRIQRRGTEDETLVGVAPPVAYREIVATVTGERRIGPAIATLGGNVGQYRYEPTRIDDVRVPLDDNNFRHAGVDGRIAVAIGPAIGAFVAATYNDARYARSVRVPQRDSVGSTFLGGIAVASPLARGEIGIGYIRQNFASPTYRDIRGIAYAVKIDWSPTRVIDVNADIGRTFQRSALLGAAGIRLDRAAVGADYELRRNLLVNAALAYVVSDYRGLDLRTRRIDGSMSVRYLANATLAVVGTLSTARQYRAAGAAGATLARDYDRLRVTVGVRVQL